jgi:hypothetical protein
MLTFLRRPNSRSKANPSFWNVTGSIRNIKTQIKVVNQCRDGTTIAELSMLKLTHSFQGPVEGCIKLALNAATDARLLGRRFRLTFLLCRLLDLACALRIRE